jgi:hypothetical protein
MREKRRLYFSTFMWQLNISLLEVRHFELINIHLSISFNRRKYSVFDRRKVIIKHSQYPKMSIEMHRNSSFLRHFTFMQLIRHNKHPYKTYKTNNVRACAMKCHKTTPTIFTSLWAFKSRQSLSQLLQWLASALDVSRVLKIQTLKVPSLDAETHLEPSRAIVISMYSWYLWRPLNGQRDCFVPSWNKTTSLNIQRTSQISITDFHMP